ncbi:hypothetical protein PM082_010401 [Marasmius tenuissimus]|nr:hypothetical protein PM082_010401 [Marasmius tenuissimus]
MDWILGGKDSFHILPRRDFVLLTTNICGNPDSTDAALEEHPVPSGLFYADCLTLQDFVVKKGSGASEAHHFLFSGIKTLYLCNKAQEDLDEQLHHPTLPSLEALTISSCPSWRSSRVRLGWEDSVAEKFLTRSGCSITSLCLQSLPITDTQTLSLLKLIPTLNSLKIEEPNLLEANPNKIITSIFFRHFVVDQESYRIGTPGTTFLPLLTEITLKVKGQGLAEKDFLDAVTSRWVPDAARARDIGVECLRFVDVTVVGNGGDSDSTLESLRCFHDAGLRLNVTYQSATSCGVSMCPSL